VPSFKERPDPENHECHVAPDTLSAFAEKALTRRESERVFSHLAECPQCRAWLRKVVNCHEPRHREMPASVLYLKILAACLLIALCLPLTLHRRTVQGTSRGAVTPPTNWSATLDKNAQAPTVGDIASRSTLKRAVHSSSRRVRVYSADERRSGKVKNVSADTFARVFHLPASFLNGADFKVKLVPFPSVSTGLDSAPMAGSVTHDLDSALIRSKLLKDAVRVSEHHQVLTGELSTANLNFGDLSSACLNCESRWWEEDGRAHYNRISVRTSLGERWIAVNGAARWPPVAF
jgi:hypothetical protein